MPLGSNAFTSNQPAWILDGYNSEKVTVTAGGGTSTLTTTATAYQHAAGVNIASAGIAGSLPDMLVRASRRADLYCAQGPMGAPERTLYALSRSEIYRMPTSRAHVTVDMTAESGPGTSRSKA